MRSCLDRVFFHHRVFEDVVRFCENMKGNIPVSFLLGFFVSGVIGRWYKMYMYIPWMNQIAYATMVSDNPYTNISIPNLHKSDKKLANQHSNSKVIIPFHQSGINLTRKSGELKWLIQKKSSTLA